ncbi:MAG: S1/P1 nuclease [Cyclobacteriaceae bacterium]|nr:S1/P1 nuclease [Cyclobacteriaceae bacterium]
MKKYFVLILISHLLVAGTFAWGVTGHRAIGLVAEKHLSKKAMRKLKLLMGQESLAMTSTWMDEVRSDSTYNYTADWHWVTIETGKSYAESPKNQNGDVIMTLERLIEELKTKKLDRKKEIEYIKMIVHLVGDIHQPLHVGCCDDRGGNSVKVKWFQSNTNLHTVWDSNMIDDTKLSYTELAGALEEPTTEVLMQWQKASVRDWVSESMTYRKQVYSVGDGNLSYKYSYKNLDVVKLRLVQAGIRLAGVLNEIYK